MNHLVDQNNEEICRCHYRRYMVSSSRRHWHKYKIGLHTLSSMQCSSLKGPFDNPLVTMRCNKFLDCLCNLVLRHHSLTFVFVWLWALLSSSVLIIKNIEIWKKNSYNLTQQKVAKCFKRVKMHLHIIKGSISSSILKIKTKRNIQQKNAISKQK